MSPKTGGSVAEWLACWTQAQKGPSSSRSFRQTVHTHCAYVHQAAKLVAAFLRVAGVTAGLAESNGSLPSGSVVKVDRRIRWHYTTTILRLRIGARLTRYRNCKFHNFAGTISRHADGISRYSVPPSAGPLLPLVGFMTHVTCRLTAKNRNQLRNITLGNRVWATFLPQKRHFYFLIIQPNMSKV